MFASHSLGWDETAEWDRWGKPLLRIWGQLSSEKNMELKIIQQGIVNFVKI